jgi:hypothetical protein
MTGPTASQAWHLCHDLQLPAAQAAKRLGVGTSAYWALIAEHKLARDAFFGRRALRAEAAPASALQPAQNQESANTAWRKRRAAELLRQGLSGVIVAERLGMARLGAQNSDD